MKIKKAVILAGGLGTRIREETEFKPKPMVEIGGMPILWHIMKNLHTQGIEEFIICLGYKGFLIKDFFLNYESRVSDVQIDSRGPSVLIHTNNSQERWKVVLADTGEKTMTGGRINRVRKYIKDETFLCTYGDGLANINLSNLYKHHIQAGKTGTVTAVNPATRFGNLEIDKEGTAINFTEKPPSEDWVNGGFFLFEKEIFNYLDDYCILEKEPLNNLVSKKELSVYKHMDFWRPMDTLRESQELNELYENNNAPWLNWDSNERK